MQASLSKNALESLCLFQEVDLEIIISETIDVLSPSVISMEATQIVLQMMIQNSEHTQKFGKSEKARASAKKLIRLYELISKFNSMTGDMNTLKLQNKEFYIKMNLAQKEADQLRNKLDICNKTSEPI